METFEKIVTNNSVIINVNLISATLSEANELRNCLEEVILLTDKNVIVDLSTCQHLDSTFIGTLVLGLKKLKNKNRELILIEPKDHTKIFLTINRIETIFKMFTSIKDAVKHLEELPVQELETLSNAIPPAENVLSVETDLPKEDLAYNVQHQSYEEVSIPEYDTTKINEAVSEQPQSDLFVPVNTLENAVVSETKENNEFSDEYDENDYRHGTVEWAFGLTN